MLPSALRIASEIWFSPSANDSATGSPAARMLNVRSLTPCGSTLPEALPVSASEAIDAASIATPPSVRNVPAKATCACPAASAWNCGGINCANSPSAFSSTRLPPSTNWWRPVNFAATASLTATAPWPRQSDAGPLPSIAIDTGGAPGSLSRLAITPPCGSCPSTFRSSRFSSGAKTSVRSRSPWRWSVRDTCASVSILSGEAVATSFDVALSVATSPARSAPSAISGRSILRMSMSTGSWNPAEDPSSGAASGRRATSMRPTRRISALTFIEIRSR